MMIDQRRGSAERSGSTFDAPVATLEGPVPAGRLWNIYASSVYGMAAMNHQPYRFDGVFGYEPTLMEQDLGPDVLPFNHQMLTGLHVSWLLDEAGLRERYSISPEDVGILTFAGLIHDIGESLHPDVLAAVGKVLGDVPAGLKTEDDRQTEAAVRRFFYATLFPQVMPEVIERVEAIISHRDTTILHEIFEAAHVIQTFDTSMRAGRRLLTLATATPDLKTIESDQLRFNQLCRLYVIVGNHNLPLMRELAKQFEHARDVLEVWRLEAEALSGRLLAQAALSLPG